MFLGEADMETRKLAELIRRLKKRAEETGKRSSYWIEIGELRFLLCSAKYDTCNLNVDQKDGTFKTVVMLGGLKFQYVGERVEC